MPDMPGLHQSRWFRAPGRDNWVITQKQSSAIGWISEKTAHTFESHHMPLRHLDMRRSTQPTPWIGAACSARSRRDRCPDAGLPGDELAGGAVEERAEVAGRVGLIAETATLGDLAEAAAVAFGEQPGRIMDVADPYGRMAEAARSPRGRARRADLRPQVPHRAGLVLLQVVALPTPRTWNAPGSTRLAPAPTRPYSNPSPTPPVGCCTTGWRHGAILSARNAVTALHIRALATRSPQSPVPQVS
jgi:hypothetical protein